MLDYRNARVAGNVSASLGRTTTLAYLTAGQSYRIEYYPEDCSEAFCYTIGMAYRQVQPNLPSAVMQS